MLHESELRFVKESGLWLSDNTIANSTTAQHGLLPKLDGSSSKFLNGAGNWTTPGSTPGSSAPREYTDRYVEFRSDLDGLGYSSIGLDFTFTTTGSSTFDVETEGIWIRNATGASSGNSAVVQAITGINFRRRWLGVHGSRIKTYTSIADIRLWSGFSNAAPEGTADPGSGHLASFRFDTGAGDSNWMACVKDGSTLNAQSTGVAPNTDTMYLTRIELDTSEVRFYLDDVLVYTHTTNLPAIDTSMGCNVSVTTLTGSARSLRFARQFVWLRG